MSKVLVCGGSGFIGSNFILNVLESRDSLYWSLKYPQHYSGSMSSPLPTSMCEEPWQVINLDKFTYAADQNFRPESNNYTFVLGDICDTELVKRLLVDNAPDYIINFAAESHVDNSIKDSAPFIQTNILGTMSLLNALKWYVEASPFCSFPTAKHIKFLHVSTDEVYGSLDALGAPFSDKSPYDPSSPYAASKAASDHLVMSHYKTYKLPVIVTNCGNNYGPRQHAEKFIPTVIKNLLQNKTVPVYGTGVNIRDWVYVEDHCEALRSILKQGAPGTYTSTGVGKKYNIGGRDEPEITNVDLVHKIAKMMGKENYMIKFIEDRKGHDYRYAIQTNEELSQVWKPKVNLEEGLQRTIEWYKNE